VNKLKTLPQLRRIIAREKKKSRTIVLANGGFDLVHAGHVRYLGAAKARGDVLLVALNSDSSVRRLKGPGRPILPQAERAAIIAAFAFVDYVTIFDELNVEGLLQALKPDIHAKGSDYSRKTVPERETVLGYGGRIAIAGGPKIRSTSEVIPRILAKLKKAGVAAPGGR